MSGDRPLPPSPRRLAEARRAGRVPWSPALVGGAALAGGALALAVASSGGAFAAMLADGARAAALADPIARARAASPAAIAGEVAVLLAPVALVAAALALAAHLAQTRALWLPRRAGPRLPAASPRRAATFLVALARGVALAAIAGAVIAGAAPLLARHTGAPVALTGALALTLAIVVVAHLAAGAIALGALDWLERVRRHRADLAMSARDARDERRETEADPRWRRLRGRAAADDDAVRAALVVIVSDDAAAALAWHPRWQPVPRVTTAARGRAALALAALARRHAVPLHRDAALAPALAALAGRAVPDRLHPAVARVVVAVTAPPPPPRP